MSRCLLYPRVYIEESINRAILNAKIAKSNPPIRQLIDEHEELIPGHEPYTGAWLIKSLGYFYWFLGFHPYLRSARVNVVLGPVPKFLRQGLWGDEPRARFGNSYPTYTPVVSSGI